VPVLYPFIEAGAGFQYPIQTVFDAGTLELQLYGPFIVLRTIEPRPGFNIYGFMNGEGMMSGLLFALVVFVPKRRRGVAR
jgi:hypothetical protein